MVRRSRDVGNDLSTEEVSRIREAFENEGKIQAMRVLFDSRPGRYGIREGKDVVELLASQNKWRVQ